MIWQHLNTSSGKCLCKTCADARHFSNSNGNICFQLIVDSVAICCQQRAGWLAGVWKCCSASCVNECVFTHTRCWFWPWVYFLFLFKQLFFVMILCEFFFFIFIFGPQAAKHTHTHTRECVCVSVCGFYCWSYCVATCCQAKCCACNCIS